MASIEDNIESVIQDIVSMADYYDNDVPAKLTSLVAEINQQLKAGNFKDRTGALRRSMRAKLIDYNIEIDMKDYGYFLSFGVRGNGKSALGLTNGVATAFGVSEGTKFKSSVFGIDARKFYPLDIEEKLLEILTDGNNNNN